MAGNLRSLGTPSKDFVRVRLAAGLVTRTGVVGSVLGPELPPIKKFGNAFAKGALDACRKAGKSCVAYHKYVPSFEAPERGARVAEELAARGSHHSDCNSRPFVPMTTRS